MRLIGLLLLTLLIAALATLAYDQRERYMPGVLASVSGGPLVHDFRWEDSETNVLLARGSRVSMSYVGHDAWVGLSGLQSYERIEFPLPRRARIRDGELWLELTSEFEEGATARLRFNVNGSRRGEIVLERGITEHRVHLPLKPEDFLSDRVVLAISTTGVSPHVICRAQWDGGTVVSVKPTSHLILALDGPLSDAQDRLAAAGMPAMVLWPEEMDALQKSALLRLALTRGGIVFVPQEMAGDDSLHLTAQEADAVTVRALANRLELTHWPVALGQLNSNLAVRDLQRTSSWRFNFDRRLLPGQGSPSALAFGMRIAGLRDEDWLLTVVQDGRLIHSETLNGQRFELSREVGLNSMPAMHHQGVVDIALRRRGDNDDECREPEPAVAEIIQASVLHGAADPNFMGGLYAGLKGHAVLESAAELSAHQAMIGTATMNALFPRGALRLSGSNSDAESRIQVLPTEGLKPALDAMLIEAPEARHWLAWLITDSDGTQSPRLVRLLTDEEPPLPAAGRAAILISVP
ncbi:hypothetical protein [Pseudomonas abyssi]|uniref:hypothetical protein n=1 Tax=Pseudomonas abyssi TaxID=170540 RepID=UPI003C7C364D